MLKWKWSKNEEKKPKKIEKQKLKIGKIENLFLTTQGNANWGKMAKRFTINLYVYIVLDPGPFPLYGP